MNTIEFESRLTQNSGLRALYERVKVIPPIDAGHGFDHTLRVAQLSLVLLNEEIQLRLSRLPSDLEKDSAIAAALLHDCVPIAKDSPLRKESARLCSEKGSEWLKELNWDEEFAVIISKAVLDHSYSSGRVPDSIIGEVLQDADRLEALGALGLFRTIATGVSMGTSFFDVLDPWAKERALDDRRFTIDHFFTKLLKLPASFRTVSAKKEAERRAKFLEIFLEQLKSEI